MDKLITKQEIVQYQKFITDIYQEKRQVGRPSNLNFADIFAILMIQNTCGNNNLTTLYRTLKKYHSNSFELPCYKNFVLTLHRKTVDLLKLLLWIFQYFGSSQIQFMDSTALPVCKIYKEKKHKTMKRLARKSKTTTGWYYGIKLHLCCDIKGNPTAIKFTTSTVDDREFLKQELTKKRNKLFIADAGYLGKKYQEIGIKKNNFIITPCRSNMKILSSLWQNNMMNMRSIVETVFSITKNFYGLTQTISRSINGYLTNYVRAIFRYCFRNFGNYAIIS
jgi:Transposase DDE domain